MSERFIDRVEGSYALQVQCGDLPTVEAIRAAGHEPNGYLWEGMARLIEPGTAAKVEFDSEAQMFVAYGKRRHLERLRTALASYFADGRRTVSAVEAAQARGFEFND